MNENEKASLCQQIDGQASSYEMPEFENISIVPPNKVCLHSEVRTLGALTDGVTTRTYSFDCAFGPDYDNNAIYDAVSRPLIECVLAGGRACAIAYGQTGTGKTFTQRGMQERAVVQLFEAAPISPDASERDGIPVTEGQEKCCRDHVVYVSYFELLNDRCYDLLNSRTEVTLRDDGTGDVVVAGLTEVAAKSASEALEALEAGNSLRATEATSSNLLSSRSHAICQFGLHPSAVATDAPSSTATSEATAAAAASPFLEERECDTEKKAGVAAADEAKEVGGGGAVDDAIATGNGASGNARKGRLRIVDLAGSERREDSRDHSAERLRETKDINYSLGCLKECIRAQLLASKRLQRQHGNKEQRGAPPSHVPYRNCKLTRLLKENLQAAAVVAGGGHGVESGGMRGAANGSIDRTLFVAHVNPLRSHAAHSRNTLGESLIRRLPRNPQPSSHPARPPHRRKVTQQPSASSRFGFNLLCPSFLPSSPS